MFCPKGGPFQCTSFLPRLLGSQFLSLLIVFKKKKEVDVLLSKTRCYAGLPELNNCCMNIKCIAL